MGEVEDRGGEVGKRVHCCALNFNTSCVHCGAAASARSAAFQNDVPRHVTHVTQAGCEVSVHPPSPHSPLLYVTLLLQAP